MKPQSRAKPASWSARASLLLTALLLAAGIYFLLQKTSAVDIGRAFSQVRIQFLGLSLISVMATFLLKAWRWQFLLSTQTKAPSFGALFWSMMLGFYVNNVLPFVRVGEIARVYALNYQTGISKVQSLSTLFVEKVLEAVFLGLTVIVLLPFLILPEIIQQSHPIFWLSGVGLVVLLILYLLAYQADWVLKQIKRVTALLPAQLDGRLQQLAASALNGLSALREHRLFLAVLGTSLLIATTSILTPYFLLPAFNIQLGMAEAAVIHIGISLALVPPSTPAKIGVFDGVVAFLLLWFGLQDEAVIAVYTILFHLVVIMPQVVFGSIAAARTQWQWRTTAVPPQSS